VAELIEWERRQGMRARDGFVWSTWQPCSPDEALLVSGLHSWQVRRVCVCTACGGTGRAPTGVETPFQPDQKGGA
jgi:hypothetical protein